MRWQETQKQKQAPPPPAAGRSRPRRRRAAAHDSSDDSDFVQAEAEESPFGFEESNVVVLRGSHGVGKTAAVYACAAELNFKVIEVNATMLRSGKHLLSTFGEATQSHELGKWAGGAPGGLVGAGAESLEGPSGATAAMETEGR